MSALQETAFLTTAVVDKEQFTVVGSDSQFTVTRRHFLDNGAPVYVAIAGVYVEADENFLVLDLTNWPDNRREILHMQTVIAVRIALYRGKGFSVAARALAQLWLEKFDEFSTS